MREVIVADRDEVGTSEDEVDGPDVTTVEKDEVGSFGSSHS